MSSTPQAAAISYPTLHQFVAAGGILSERFPNFEFRRGQLEMAESVERALRERRHLIVEAGTGTGKTLAYLLPALRSGKRVIVSTGTKNLQEQLFYKDVPLLEDALFQQRGVLKVAYMKGRANYLCREKLYTLAEQPVLSELAEVEQYEKITAWEKTTETGDRAELAFLPEASQLWHKIDARADNCTGQKCPQWERCFITEMRRKAMESDLVIVNHHLFFADLAIKAEAASRSEDGQAPPDSGVLPDATVVIFDEAHELEDVAGSYFGVQVSNLRIEELCRDIQNTLKAKRKFSPTLFAALGSLLDNSARFFASLPPGNGRFAFRFRGRFLETDGDHYIGLSNAIGRVAAELSKLPEKPDEALTFLRRTHELAAALEFCMENEDRNTVFWIERRAFRGKTAGRFNVFLQATRIDVSEILRRTLFSRFSSIVLTSATMAVSNTLDYVTGRLGIENAREAVIPSHFDYPRQALLYVPADLPDARSPEFLARAADRVRDILKLTCGRAFCLFTSYAQMQRMYERLLAELPYELLLQGSAPKTALLEQFREAENAVLFATSSFWQGVDVQGEQLSCVIIDKLPFAVPNDPIVEARINALKAENQNAFLQYQVPEAVLTLKQGFGRLIRSLDDRGLLVLLDNRILRQHYGRVFFDSLPNYHRVTTLDEIEDFFAEER
ncbi:MAG: ATP-dependent DNA helicase [Acidobacteriaceae bacterium]